MNLKKQYERGTKIYQGVQEQLAERGRVQHGKKVDEIILGLPDRVFEAAKMGVGELVLITSDADDFQYNMMPRNRSMTFIVLDSFYHGPHPKNGTLAQVLHEKLKENNIPFATHVIKDETSDHKGDIETYITLKYLP